MKRIALSLLMTVVSFDASPSQQSMPEAPASPALARDCSALAGATIADVKISAATATPAGTGWSGADQRRATPVKAPFCRVQGTIEGTIGFELWLPAKDSWNGKLLGAGVGGAAGAFNFADLPRGVNRGYAAATTDTGHKASDPTWMLRNPRALQNFEIRANHLLPVKAKEIIRAFYARPADRAYFIGCSGGGRQGLKELQRYPADYDGIITGANGPRTPEMTVRRMWEIIQRDANSGLMTPADWQFVSESGVKACDGLDGVIDGVAEDPRQCRFDVAALTCKPGQTSQCLTPKQVAFAKSFYAPLRDASGRAIDGGILPGVLIDSGRSQLAIGTFGQAVRGLEKWDGKDFDAARDLAAIKRVMPELGADDPDVSAFRNRGGKVLLYTGWMDGAVSARMVADYYEALVAKAGGRAAAAGFSRLYMLPGVYHCAGGPGADQIGGAGGDAPIVDERHDMLTALERWVEQGKAPGPMVAAKVDQGRVTRQRLICPYPQQARYKGKGDKMDPAAFTCAAPAKRAS